MAKGKSEPKMVTKIQLIPTDEERGIIMAGMKKHGAKKAVEILRMALRRFAEVEKFQLKAS